MRKPSFLSLLLVVGALLSLGVTLQRPIRASVLSNLALVKVLKAPACDHEWFVCKAFPKPYPVQLFQGNETALVQAQELLVQALSLLPNSSRLRLHLAEIEFSLQERGKAAQYIAELPDPFARASPLLDLNRFEARLVRANIAAEAQDWASAIENYRLGLAWGDERTLVVDEQEYLRTLAALEQEHYAADPENIQAIYQVGKYLTEAGEWEKAFPWLERGNEVENLTHLSAEQGAWVNFYLGRYAQIQGDFSAARSAYLRAIELAPNLRQPYLYLIDLLCMDQLGRQKETLEAQLLELGPAYLLGAQGDGYLAPEPAELPGGWKLIGYDLDEEMLEQTKRLELILWWQSGSQQPAGEGWTQVGNYWLQRQVVTNLFPNAGFEWGVDERGIPLGYDRELYRDQIGDLTVKFMERGKEITQVANANNSRDVRNVALVSRMVPVDGNDFYLMSGWIWDQGSSATIGRSCTRQSPISESPYYIAGYQEQPFEQWISYSNLSSVQPDYHSLLCVMLLMNNNNSEKPANWDNVIWIRVQITFR